MKNLIILLFVAVLLTFIIICQQFSDVIIKNKEIPEKPKRIISLCRPVTEIICQLGATDKIVGIGLGDCPIQVENKPRVGKSFGELNVEAIIALKPDLVFCWGKNKILQEKGIPLYPVYTKDIQGVIDLVKDISILLEKKECGEKIIFSMKNTINNISSKLQQVSRYPVVYFEGSSMGRSRGPGSLTHELIVKAGGINLAGKEPTTFPVLNSEYIIVANPDIIIVEEYGDNIKNIKKREGWEGIKAIKNNRIYKSSVCYTNYSPKCIKGLKQFAFWLHPELFKEDYDELR